MHSSRYPDAVGIFTMRAARRSLTLIGIVATLLATLAPVSRSAPPDNKGNPPGIEKLADHPEAERRIRLCMSFLRSNMAGFEGGVEGRRSLAALAFAKCGFSSKDPFVGPAVDHVLTLFRSNGDYSPAIDQYVIYVAGVNAMLLGAVDSEKYRPNIQAIGRFLVQRQNENGSWGYPSDKEGDTSVSQYGILGLWEATRHGLEVEDTVWSRAARWHFTGQQRDGGFVYRPNEAGTSTFTMTVAATGSLLICRRHLYPEDKEEASVKDTPSPVAKRKARRYGILESAESVERIPIPAAAQAPAAPPRIVPLQNLRNAISRGHLWLQAQFTAKPPTQWNLYYLYGLERLAALYGSGFLGGRDWYGEGLAAIAQMQSENGGLTDASTAQGATSFAILFLAKATAKIVGPPPKRAPTFGTGLLVGGRGLPDNLSEARLNDGSVESRKPKTPVEELLAQLENPSALEVDTQQTQLVEQISTDDIRALIGQTDRLLKLARDKRVEVRRTAYWALGRTDDLRVVPFLIEALADPDPACVVEARNALQFLSRRPVNEPPGDEPTDDEKRAAIKSWRKWYLSVRPYADRDDLIEGK